MTTLPDPPTASSRRALLKAGAHAAWAVPAVQLATSAPAFAVGSGIPAAALAVTGTTFTWKNPSDLIGTITVKNNGTAAGAGVQVTFSQLTVDGVTKPAAIYSATTPWAFVGTVATLAGTLAVGASSTLSFTITGANGKSNKPASVKYAVTVTGGTGTSGTLTK